MSLPLTFESKSDVGLERSENQDFFGSKVMEDASFYIVCDGMGGHAGGSTASRVAVTTIEEQLEANPSMPVAQRIDHAVLSANEAIFQMARRKPALRGMGTTVVMIGIEHATKLVWMAHVGDSRGYRLRGNKFWRVTRDHTMVQRLVDDGILSDEDAENHPNANIISRSLGSRENVEVDIFPEPMLLEEGDAFLLCSDGLYGLVSEKEVGEKTATMLPAEACDHLVARACEEGGHDNITVEIIWFGAQPAPSLPIEVIKPKPPVKVAPVPAAKSPSTQPLAAAAASPEGSPTASDEPMQVREVKSSGGGTSILWLLIILVVVAATIIGAYKIAFDIMGVEPVMDAAPEGEGPSMGNPAEPGAVVAPPVEPPPPTASGSAEAVGSGAVVPGSADAPAESGASPEGTGIQPLVPEAGSGAQAEPGTGTPLEDDSELGTGNAPADATPPAGSGEPTGVTGVELDNSVEDSPVVPDDGTATPDEPDTDPVAVDEASADGSGETNDVDGESDQPQGRRTPGQ